MASSSAMLRGDLQSSTMRAAVSMARSSVYSLGRATARRLDEFGHEDVNVDRGLKVQQELAHLNPNADCSLDFLGIPYRVTYPSMGLRLEDRFHQASAGFFPPSGKPRRACANSAVCQTAMRCSAANDAALSLTAPKPM